MRTQDTAVQSGATTNNEDTEKAPVGYEDGFKKGTYNKSSEEIEIAPEVDEEGLKDHCLNRQRYKFGSIEGECKDRLVQEFKEVGR